LADQPPGDHIRPFQVPPVQAVPAVRLEARVAVETAATLVYLTEPGASGTRS